MRAIRSNDTGPEVRLRQALWRMGARYRLRQRIGRVKPDLVFRGARVAVFVDGCFWHGCPEHYRAPSGNARYWSEKVEGNQQRDRRNDEALRAEGWTVIRVWECKLESALQDVASRILSVVRGPADDSGAE